VAIVAYGVAGYMWLEGWGFVEALYMTMISLTTVGFKEVKPLDASGQLFTITLLLLGVVLVLITLSLAARAVAEGALGERSRRKRMLRRIDSLKDHFIICATLEGVLRDAGIDRARGLVCALDSDANNVYITLAARSLNQRVFIVGRASDPAAGERLYRAGADRVISPYVSSGRHMAMMALRPRVVDYLEVAPRDAPALRFEELQVEAGSDLVGRELSDACGGNIALAVRRAGGEIVPNPSPALRLEAGDLLMLLGEKDALRPVEGS
jgi:voltage-gated potassium channel